MNYDVVSFQAWPKKPKENKFRSQIFFQILGTSKLEVTFAETVCKSLQI